MTEAGRGNRPANLRDLGGLPTVDGSTTRAGVLYRSDCPLAGDLPPADVPAWPPRQVVDLRNAEERAATGHPLAAAGCEVTELGMITGSVESMVGAVDLTVIYPLLLDQGAPALVRLLEIAARADGPVLVHCATGKDRTGLAAALLLRAAGVTRPAVLADYLATGPNLAATYARRGMTGGLGISEPAFHGALRLVDDEGGAWPWFLARGAGEQTLRAWRRRLVAS